MNEVKNSFKIEYVVEGVVHNSFANNPVAEDKKYSQNPKFGKSSPWSRRQRDCSVHNHGTKTASNSWQQGDAINS